MITRVTQGSERFSAAASTWSVDGIVSPGANDIVLVSIIADGTYAMSSVPTGFTELIAQIDEVTDFETRVWWGKGSDVGSGPWSFVFTANEQGHATWASYSGVDTTTPIDVTSASVDSGGVGSTVVDCPAITPVTPGAMMIGIADTESGVATTMAWDVGVTEVLDVNVTTVPGTFVTWGERYWHGLGSDRLQGDCSTARGTTKISIALRPNSSQGTPPSATAAGATAEDLTGAASTVPAVPAHAVNDILVAVSYNANGDTMSTATAGWAEITEIDGTDNIAFYWKRATATSGEDPDITAAGTDQWAIGFVVSGCITSGTPYEDATTSGNGTTTDTTPDTAAIDVTGDNRLVLAILGQDDNVDFSSGSPPTGWAVRHNVVPAGGTGAHFNVIQKIAGTSTVAAQPFGTLGTAEIFGALTLAFIPAVVTPSIVVASPMTPTHIHTVGFLYAR